MTPTGLGHRVESKPVRRAPRGLYMIGQAGGDGWSGQYGWYAVRTAPNSERPLIEYLKANSAEFMSGLSTASLEVFTPLEVNRVQVRNGRGNSRANVPTRPSEPVKPPQDWLDEYQANPPPIPVFSEQFKASMRTGAA